VAETPEQLATRVESERADIRVALANVVLAWNDLENFLAVLLQTIMGSTEGLAFKIYFTPNNTETRLRLVEVALGHCHGITGIDDDSLRQCMNKFVRKLQDAQGSRNKIAHYQIVTSPIGEVLHARLMPPILNWNKALQTGLGKNELDQIAVRIAQCGQWTRRLSDVLKPAPNMTPQTLLEKFTELKKSLNVDDPASCESKLP